MIKVRAIKPGFYQRLYKTGETFQVPREKLSRSWMEPVESEKKQSRGKKSGAGDSDSAGDQPSADQ